MKRTVRQHPVQYLERGYAMAPLLIFLTIAMAVLTGWMRLSMSSTRTVGAIRARTVAFGQAEGALNAALAWLRANSGNMMPLFKGENFCTNFTLPAAVNYGTNDPSSGPFAVPTQPKIRGSSDSAMLLYCNTDCSNLGTGSFPSVGGFTPITAFGGLNAGSSIVKVSLVDVVPFNHENKETPVNPDCAVSGVSDNDFIPVYRVDAMTGNDSGSRVFGYVTGSLSYPNPLGFYGADKVEVEKPCVSDTFNGSSPTQNLTNFNAKCPIGSRGDVTFKNNPKSRIYGTVTTTGGTVNETRVCGDTSCATQGNVCEGATCNLPDPFIGLCPGDPNPAGGPYDKTPFNTLCHTNQTEPCSPASQIGNMDPDDSSFPAAPANVGTRGCYGSVDIPNNFTLTLTSAGDNTPYYFRVFDLGNGKGKLSINPTVPEGVIEVHVEKLLPVESPGCIVRFNGSQGINIQNNKNPRQFKLVYWGICDVEFSGTSNESLVFYAPNANVTIGGNADFFGAAFAKSLKFKDQGGHVVFDEGMSKGELSGITYRLRNMEETYR